MIRFANPGYLQWTLIILILWFFLALYEKRQRRIVSEVFGKRIYPFLSASLSLTRVFWNRVLLCLGCLFLLLALARPQMGAKTQETRSQGIELVLAADVSLSMMADDLKPTRLDQMKAELDKIIDQLGGHRVGILAFAGSATLLSPLTNDPGALHLYVESLSPDVVSSGGTSFQSAFEEAKKAFEKGGVTETDTDKVTRVIVLASDGEDQEQGAVEIVRDLRKAGITTYTIAYGTEQGASIPERDMTGYLSGFKKDISGNTVVTKVHGEALKELAKEGGGKFYFSVFGGSHIKDLLKDIERLEKNSVNTSVSVLYDEKFQWPLFFTFLCFLIEFVNGNRRKKYGLWKGRFEMELQE